MLKVVLVKPLIPQNTGTIARMTAGTSCELHLIEPLGFELSDKYLKRAGLDYWSEVILFVHASWDAFLTSLNDQLPEIHLFSTHAERRYDEVSYGNNAILVFGNESEGLPDDLHERYVEQRRKIPIDNPRIRSLNLSNAVSIVVYEARRQHYLKLKPTE